MDSDFMRKIAEGRKVRITLEDKRKKFQLRLIGIYFRIKSEDAFQLKGKKDSFIFSDEDVISIEVLD